MPDTKKSTKCRVQFARTVERTGKWRGKKANEYIKYKKIKKEPKKMHKLDKASGFMSLDGNGKPLYVRIGKGAKPKLILSKIYNKKNDSHKTSKTTPKSNPKPGSKKVSSRSQGAWREFMEKIRHTG